MSDDDRTTLKQWLVSVSVVLALQIGALVWFLATTNAEVGRLGRIVDRLQPEHAEIYYFYKQTKNHDDNEKPVR